MNASQLTFDGAAGLTPSSQWSADPAQRTVGTISLLSPNGDSVDLIAAGSIRSGKIAAYLEMRDQTLPQAQAQLDELAATMSSALSDKTTAGTAVSSGAQSGFDIDAGSLVAGNRIEIGYTDNLTGAQRKVTVVRVDDPAALPLRATGDPNNTVIGVDFSAGPASVAAKLNTALAATGLQFSTASGSTLRVLDDGTANRINVGAVSATTTATSLSGGSGELPFFTDGTKAYSGAVTVDGAQSVGLAARIAVNRGLLADPSKLVSYQSSTASGDATRPNLLYDRLTGTLGFSPRGGIGTAAAPFKGSISDYLAQVISQQGQAADAADSLKQGQDVVVNSLQQRLNDSSSVNVDTEMANLLSLQTAYSANARVMTAVRDMLDLLLKI
jgi:flagellar hook-associated protein 1 FlgK